MVTAEIIFTVTLEGNCLTNVFLENWPRNILQGKRSIIGSVNEI